MELDAFDLVLFVAEAHDEPVACRGGDLDMTGQIQALLSQGFCRSVIRP